MDWSSIGAAALAGGLGALFGAFIGALLGRLFPEKHRKVITTVFAVLFAIVTPRVVEALLEEPVTAATIEAQLLDDPEFGPLARAWKQAEPATFSSAVDRIEVAVRSGSDRTAAVNDLRALLLSAAVPRMSYLGDAEILELIAISRDQYLALAVAQPAVCHPMFMGAPFGDITPYLSESLQQREAALIRASFQVDQSATRAILREAELSAAIDEALAETRERIGDDVDLLVTDAQITGREERYCLVVAEFFATVLALAPERAAAFMRGLRAES